MHRKTRKSLPNLHDRAAKLLCLCLFPILLYLCGTVWYGLEMRGDPVAMHLVRELLHSIGISALLALGGALLLDSEIRLRE